MKMELPEKPWYLEERAEGLAVIYLTEDSRVDINRSRDRLSGLDIVATLRENGKLGARIFGVEVTAARSQEAGHDNPTPAVWSIPESRLSFFRDIPFPVCLFYITVDDDQGHWGWIQQPIIGADTGARLTFHEHIYLSPLSVQDIPRLVSEIDRWYEERK